MPYYRLYYAEGLKIIADWDLYPHDRYLYTSLKSLQFDVKMLEHFGFMVKAEKIGEYYAVAGAHCTQKF